MAPITDYLKLDPAAKVMPPRAWIALFLVALVAMVPGFFNLPAFDRDESRYAQASRQMMETGDYIDIHFQDQVRYVKPVGAYWAQVVTALPLGGEDAPIWAHRLPSLLSTLYAVGLIAWFGTRIGGAGVGLSAGLLMALCLSVGVDARMAKTDALLMAATATSMVALYFIMIREKAETLAFKGAPLVFWAASGVGLLVKGPIILFCSVPAIIVLALWRRDLSFLKRLHILPGIAVMLAIFLPWFVAIMIKTGGDFWYHSVGHALMGKVTKGDDSHGAPPGYHTILMLILFWPSALLLGLTVINAWRQRKLPEMQFLIAWFLPFWVIYELVATKLPHYTLPVYPALALLAAFALKEAGELLKSKAFTITHWVFVALFVLVSLVLGYLPYWLAGEMETTAPGISWLSTLFAIAVAASGIWLALKPSLERTVPLVLCALGFHIFTLGAMLPSMDRFFLSHTLKEKIAAIGGCETPQLVTIDYREPSLVFNFGTDTLLGERDSAVAHLATHRTCGIAAIGQKEYLPFLQAAEAAGVPVKILGSVEGFNYSKGDILTLTILSHSDADYPVPEAGGD